MNVPYMFVKIVEIHIDIMRLIQDANLKNFEKLIT